MKKIIILLSIILFTSCSYLQENGGRDTKVINKAEQTAKSNINKYTDQEIARAKKEIGDAVASVISKADSTLTKQFSVIENSLNTKAEETKKELNGKISGIENNITIAKAISLIGIAIGLFGTVLAFLAYRKKPKTNVNRVKDIIAEEVKPNGSIYNEIRKILGGPSLSNRPQAVAPSLATIERAVETYLNNRNYKHILQQYITESIKRELSVISANKPMYQIYARESNSMDLSNIQNTYQKGKSIYKLSLTEPNATTAEISLCIEQEEVKQRILKFDSQYLEPICSVTRSSNEPTQVIIKTTGIAERNGEEWKVIRPIIVEIK